ncbi:MAG: DUF1002 domain-containing protein [Clostridium sp.]
MKKTLKLMVAIFTLSIFLLPFTSKLVFADSFKVVTLGADLTSEQKSQMLKEFGVSKKDANILEVTKKEEDKYLKDIATAKQIGTKSISCSYVEPTSSGGLDVSTDNISWVTEGMIKNALITAGVEHAIVKASAPFKVSGTAALTGILKGFENSKGGEKIPEDKKEAANEEIVVTGNLGDKIGQDQAANLINEVKTEVLKANPKTEEEIKNIIVNVVNNNNINLSNEDIEKITGLMDKINSLDIDFNKIKDQLNEVSNVLKDTLGSEEAQGFFASIKDFFTNLINSINSLFN